MTEAQVLFMLKKHGFKWEEVGDSEPIPPPTTERRGKQNPDQGTLQ